MSFENILAAVEARRAHQHAAESKDLWSLGAAIIKDCGKPTPSDVGGSRFKPDGSYAKLIKAAEFLKTKGFDEYVAHTLAEIRDVTITFPSDVRDSRLTFWAHAEALNPEILKWVLKNAPVRKRNRGAPPITVIEIRELVKRWRRKFEEKRKSRLSDAQDRKSKATSDKDREDAQRDIDENKGMPSPRNIPAPEDQESESELRTTAVVLDIDSDAEIMIKKLRDNQKRLTDLEDIDPEFIEALVDHHQEVATIATQIADRLGKVKIKRFPVIKGGAA